MRHVSGIRARIAARVAAVAVALLCAAPALQAAEIVGLNDATTRVTLTPFLSVYRDTTGARTLADVQSEFARGQFAPCTGNCPAFGFTTDAVWVRFVAQGASQSGLSWLLELQTTRMDEVDVYFVQASGAVEHKEAGNARRPSPRVVDGRQPAFPFRFAAGERLEVFVRVYSETSVQLPLDVWEATAFEQAQVRRDVPFALLFGYMAALIVFGFVFSVFARDIGYATYSLSLIGFCGAYFIMSGQYAVAALPGRAFAAKTGVILMSELAVGMMIPYLRHLLDLGRTMPRIDGWMRWILWSVGPMTLLLVAFPFGTVYVFIIAHLTLMGMSSMAVAIVAWLRGSHAGRDYARAWILFWILFGVTQTEVFARIPPSLPDGLFIMLGTTLSATLFLVAMVSRVGEIRRGMQQAQEQLLALERQTSRDLRQQMQQEQMLIRDLHDGIGGLTANVAILAEVGRRDTPAGEARDRFEQISRLASEGGAEVRSLISSIEAREMSWPDVFAECRRYGHVVLPPHGIAFDFAEQGYEDQPGPGLFAGLSLFRVFKEALTNAVKHSGCTDVSARAEFGPRQFRLTVRDNGRGMSAGSQEGRGLRNMASRIGEMGGTMQCRSQGGTELVFDLPLPLTLSTSLLEDA